MTLDTGALIGYERKDPATLMRIKVALDDSVRLTVPAPCLAEAWRGGAHAARLARLRASIVVEPLDESLARAAGELLGMAGARDAVDAAVVAGAARRGDLVLTSDSDDLSRLAAHVRHVSILAV